MTAGLDFGPIRDDDELLDRLGSRRSSVPARGEEDSLAGMLAAWTAEIDADEREQSANVGPLGLRRVPGIGDDTAPRVKVVQLRRARAVAVLGALALTVSGGGVAAALTNGGPVTAVITKAAGIVGVPVPTATQTPAMNASALPQAVESLRQAVNNGDYGKAQGIIEVLRLLPTDPSSPQITREVEELAKQVPPVLPSTAVAPPVDKPTTATTAPTRAGTTSATTTTVPPVTTAPPATPTPTAPTPDKTTGRTTDPSTPTTKQPTTPTSPAPVPSAPPSVGGVGGGQTAGTGTAPAKDPTRETGQDVEPGRGEGSTGASRGSDHGVTGVDAAPADDAAEATSGSASGHASR